MDIKGSYRPSLYTDQLYTKHQARDISIVVRSDEASNSAGYQNEINIFPSFIAFSYNYRSVISLSISGKHYYEYVLNNQLIFNLNYYLKCEDAFSYIPSKFIIPDGIGNDCRIVSLQ